MLLKVDNIAIGAMALDKQNQEIEALNKWNKANGGAVTSYTSISGNTVEVIKTLQVIGGDPAQRDPNASCGQNGDCGSLELGEFSGFTHYFGGCFEIKESALRAELNGQDNRASINTILGREIQAKINNHYTDIEVLAVKSAIGSEAGLVKAIGSQVGTEQFIEDLVEAGYAFGNQHDRLSTVLLESLNADRFRRGFKQLGFCNAGGCDYFTLEVPLNQKNVRKVVSPEADGIALLLTEGAIRARDMEPLQIVVRETGKAGNVCYEVSYAGAVNITIKGYDFNTALEKNASVGEIGDSANWELKVDKGASAGVLVNLG